MFSPRCLSAAEARDTLGLRHAEPSFNPEPTATAASSPIRRRRWLRLNDQSCQNQFVRPVQILTNAIASLRRPLASTNGDRRFDRPSRPPAACRALSRRSPLPSGLRQVVHADDASSRLGTVRRFPLCESHDRSQVFRRRVTRIVLRRCGTGKRSLPVPAGELRRRFNCGASDCTRADDDAGLRVQRPAAVPTGQLRWPCHGLCPVPHDQAGFVTSRRSRNFGRLTFAAGCFAPKNRRSADHGRAARARVIPGRSVEPAFRGRPVPIPADCRPIAQAAEAFLLMQRHRIVDFRTDFALDKWARRASRRPSGTRITYWFQTCVHPSAVAGSVRTSSKPHSANSL